MKGGTNLPDPGPDPANVDSGVLSTNAQAIPLPMFSGEAKFALTWISPPYNQSTLPAPDERPGKK